MGPAPSLPARFLPTACDLCGPTGVYIVYMVVYIVYRSRAVSRRSFLGEFEQMVLLGILHRKDTAFALEVRREIERTP
jgi:hypothetical protein